MTKPNKSPKTPEASGKKEETVQEAVIHQFDPKKLRGSDGIWKYIADPELVSRETFYQQKAKDYGIKANDVVIVSLDGNVKTLGI